MPKLYCLQYPDIKFADDTAIIRLINNKNKIAHRSEVSKFIQWCKTYYLQLNVSETIEMAKTLITRFYMSAIESILSFCVTYWDGNVSKGDR